MATPYRDSAAFYDGIYDDKDYVAEAASVHTLVLQRCPRARTLLDVGCGTGGHLAQLRQWFEVHGADVSAQMIARAAEKLPEVPLHVADLRELSLGRSFDAVVCLFSAIGYVASLEELRRGVAAMAQHVAPGGVLAIEPWFTPEAWRPWTVHGSLAIDRPELKVARLVRSEVRGRISVMPMHHLVASTEGVEHFVETHEMFLATEDEIAQAFADAGLRDVELRRDALVRGLWLGTR